MIGGEHQHELLVADILGSEERLMERCADEADVQIAALQRLELIGRRGARASGSPRRARRSRKARSTSVKPLYASDAGNRPKRDRCVQPRRDRVSRTPISTASRIARECSSNASPAAVRAIGRQGAVEQRKTELPFEISGAAC